MTKKIRSISPIDGTVIAERNVVSDNELVQIINRSEQMQKIWAKTPISDKAVLCHQAIDALLSQTDEISVEITKQMGRPIQFCSGELRGVAERARYMIENAEQALADINIENSDNKKRFIQRVPLGVVFIIAPWNYPYLTAINSIISALMAGNSVLLKHSAQTLLCAERFGQAFEQAGFPSGVFQYCHCDHIATTTILKSPKVNYISFTGSVSSGSVIETNVAGLFKPLNLELGGNDPAYVRADISSDPQLLNSTIENIVDGVYFNSGQSCCAVERIYVHDSLYDKFTEQFIEHVKQYQLANPLDENTTLGPVINSSSADKINQQLIQATNKGATVCIPDNYFNTNELPNNFIAPQVLLNVDHSMEIMTTESFGPIVGIMKVQNDKHAIELMNDSRYGLTASIWSSDVTQSLDIADKLHTGTVFLNRCDYLDPALAWVGVKDSGRGCSLSVLAYQQLTRPKSYHFQF